MESYNYWKERWSKFDSCFLEAFACYLKVFPYCLGMSANQFCKYAEERNYPNFRNWLRRGPSHLVEYDDLARLLSDIYNAYLHGLETSPEKHHQAMTNWEKLKGFYFETLSELFSFRENIQWMKTITFYFNDVIKIWTLELLRLGKYFDEGTLVTKAQIEWLQECLNYYHPKSFLK